MTILEAVKITAMITGGAFIVTIILWSILFSMSYGVRNVWDFWRWMARGGWRE